MKFFFEIASFWVADALIGIIPYNYQSTFGSS